MSTNESSGKGSARSIYVFDIGTQIIKATQSGIIEKGGGHKMAGGFTIKKENIPLFRDFLIKNFKKSQLSSSKVINLYLDSLIAPSALNEEFYFEIEKLAPFGSGNNEPKFVIENLQLISSDLVADKHRSEEHKSELHAQAYTLRPPALRKKK